VEGLVSRDNKTKKSCPETIPDGRVAEKKGTLPGEKLKGGSLATQQ